MGWPWTKESSPPPDVISNGSLWPRISIVTPSYNQSQFIEETIRSVLLQGYPDLEYIIVDGQSTDGTVEIIKKYEPWLAYWTSEKDRGQSHAINKGMARATGEIVAWLNSDDMYLPLALSRVASAWQTSNTHWLVGMIKAGESLESIETKTLRLSSSRSFTEIAAFWLLRERNLRNFSQPEVFVSHQAWNAVNGLCENLSLALDYHLWARLAALGYVPKYLPEEIAFFRIHPAQKTRPEKNDYAMKVLIERTWSLYDAIRLAQQAKLPPPGLEEVRRLLERQAGGYCRVLDAYYRSLGLHRMVGAIITNALFRPATTLSYTPRIVIRECIRGWLHGK
jgi:glycosyltransferase involved in cell wall biosynthesis